MKGCVEEIGDDVTMYFTCHWFLHSYTVGCGNPLRDKGVHDREGEGSCAGYL